MHAGKGLFVSTDAQAKAQGNVLINVDDMLKQELNRIGEQVKASGQAASAEISSPTHHISACTLEEVFRPQMSASGSPVNRERRSIAGRVENGRGHKRNEPPRRAGGGRAGQMFKPGASLSQLFSAQNERKKQRATVCPLFT
ncbi:TPA: hypothetical protein MYL61_004648 [Klebsiella quasipneumoniae subsp. quasipneumoniae]|nr:hypothetical protein [Klebsiella quasipneumoniae subsp. quasipneumoniae]